MKVNLGKVSDYSARAMSTVYRDSLIFLLYNDGSTIRVYDGKCPHRHALLGAGKLDESILTCPWHEFQFDLRTGECITNRFIKLKCYTHRIVNDEIEVEIYGNGTK